MAINAALFWSGGKDSALSLYQVLSEKKFHVKYLITTLNAGYRRVSMHGVREILIERQAEAIGIPLKKMWVEKATNQEYEAKLSEVLSELKNENISKVIFGDIFLEEIRQYREKLLSGHQMNGVFPLWNKSTRELSQWFLDSGIQAVTCCVNGEVLNDSWLGKRVSKKFFNELPAGVNHFGENGEYHSFVLDTTFFHNEINFVKGEKVFKQLEIKKAEEETSALQGFWYLDLLPV